MLALTYQVQSQKISQITFGNYTESISILKPEEFNIEGTWEVIHREWEFDCEREYKLGDTLGNYSPPYIMQDYMHLGELIHFDKTSIRTCSSIFSSQEPFIRFRKGYWNLQEYMYYTTGFKECKGQYYLNRFGEKQLVVEANCSFRNREFSLDTLKGYDFRIHTRPKDGMSLYYFFVLNENLIVKVTSYSIVYLKRSKQSLHFPINKEGYYVITGTGGNIGFDLEISSLDFKPDNYIKIVCSSNMLYNKKPLTIRNYTKFYCENFEHSTINQQFIYGDSFTWKQDGQQYSTAPYVSESGNRIYIPFNKLNRNILDISKRKNIKAFELWFIYYKILKPFYRQIKKNTNIHYEPNKGKTSILLFKGTPAKILDEESEYYYIEYGEKERNRGWILKSDVE